MASNMVPMLMFAANADEAISLYVSLFENSGVLSMEYYGPDEQGAEGSLKKASFVVAGQHLLAIDSPIEHDFSFTPAISLFVECASTEHFQDALAQLSDGGKVLMPADNYGHSELFAWVSDRFGVSWQLSVG
ncbi:VOC family protein [Gilvimarinus polysaccharolyticus]|uniref:VOC family protein n=1 Tax=Gilvimarinus polysaccharolyticus TaxID=863921 RepID=UPI0006738B36|nr:VOC family protein [Gilvimarinus polysaccharolyticus]